MVQQVTFELNVPSGIMVYNDSLPEFEVLGDYDINTEEGCIKQTLAMTKIGCAHGFVGNTCPGIYQVDKDRFTVAIPGYNKKTLNSKRYKGKQVGSITTDLWWFSLADGDEYQKRGGDLDDVRQTKVRPGVYQVVHNLDFRRDRTKQFDFAVITWIREPDPPKDYLEEFRNRNYTAGQIIDDMRKRSPRYYGGENGMFLAANMLMCVIGTGGNWHPNGFVQYEPELPEGLEECPIPQFDECFKWYPLSEYSALVGAANGKYI